jgi:hypothetical protein
MPIFPLTIALHIQLLGCLLQARHSSQISDDDEEEEEDEKFNNITVILFHKLMCYLPSFLPSN